MKIMQWQTKKKKEASINCHQTMKRIQNLGRILLFGVCIGLSSCARNHAVPDSAQPNGKQVVIYPDYTGVTIPPNIAPLNFIIKSNASEYTVQIKGTDADEIVTGAQDDGVVQIDSALWRSMLTKSKGREIDVLVYEKQGDQWYSFKPFKLYVANEEIDPYLSYRLVEPGFELYRQLGLYQRNLTNFEQKVIYENNRVNDSEQNHCVNCHNFQNYGGRNMLFHVRANMGGTIIAKDGKIEKINFKNDSILGSAVYPSWHPKKNYVVFSSNLTGQAFHMQNNEKIEVLDYGSDLVFYNADTHEVSNIIKGEASLETFPTWSPDGRKIYFCQTESPEMAGVTDSVRMNYVIDNYRSLQYNVMSVGFDEKTMTFGTPEIVVDCVSMNKSASVPRVSPDGKYLLFTLGDYGQFHIWHKSSDQWVKNLQTGETYPLAAANSNDVDSYHSWSSNGRWFVFSSRRDDGSYTRPYMAYFDKNGQTRKAFMLPQEDPVQNLMLLKSYNVPELTRHPISYTPEMFKETIYNQNPGTSVTYKELRTADEIKEQQRKDAQARLMNRDKKRMAADDSARVPLPVTDATSGASRRSR